MRLSRQCMFTAPRMRAAEWVQWTSMIRCPFKQDALREFSAKNNGGSFSSLSNIATVTNESTKDQYEGKSIRTDPQKGPAFLK